jgi:hypothetical protein
VDIWGVSNKKKHEGCDDPLGKFPRGESLRIVSIVSIYNIIFLFICYILELRSQFLGHDTLFDRVLIVSIVSAILIPVDDSQAFWLWYSAPSSIP